MLMSGISARIGQLQPLIGNTPMVGIRYRFGKEERIIFAKCEYYNLTGSIKDRMAVQVLGEAYRKGKLKPGHTIVEATSGNAGISLASIGRYLGHKVIIVMPEWATQERVRLLRSLGAEVVLTTRADGDFQACVRKAEAIEASMPNVYYPRQFENEDNAQGHFLTSGPEIERQMQRLGKTPDAFVAAIGTGGTIMGNGAYLRTRYHCIRVHPVESLQSLVVSTGVSHGAHRIPGISDDWNPPLVDLSKLDHPFTISDGDGIIMTQLLGKKLGLGVGISSGFNFLGAVAFQNKYGGQKTAVTVFSDCSKKYLSGTLLHDEPQLPEYLTNHIELIDYFAVR
jgi:cysteine synthase A